MRIWCPDGDNSTRLPNSSIRFRYKGPRLTLHYVAGRLALRWRRTCVAASGERESASGVFVGVRCEHQTCRFAGIARHRHDPIKTASAAGVTGVSVAVDCDAQPEHVLVAVGAHFDDIKHVAAFRALLPECARERLQKWTMPVSMVSASASAFMNANINASPLSASVTIAGMRPSASNFGAEVEPGLEFGLGAARGEHRCLGRSHANPAGVKRVLSAAARPDGVEEALTPAVVLGEDAGEVRRLHDGVGLIDGAQRHALMHRADHHGDARAGRGSAGSSRRSAPSGIPAPAGAGRRCRPRAPASTARRRGDRADRQRGRCR